MKEGPASRPGACAGHLVLRLAHAVQDITVRWVIEYSEKPDFSDLPPLKLNTALFDKTALIDSAGQDIVEDLVISGGLVKAGRFVYAKLTPGDIFSFPRGETRQLQNGVVYYFQNYKVRDGCISNDYVPDGDGVRITQRFPTEVLTRPSSLEVCPSAALVLRAVFAVCFPLGSCLLFPFELREVSGHVHQPRVGACAALSEV